MAEEKKTIETVNKNKSVDVKKWRAKQLTALNKKSGRSFEENAARVIANSK